MTLSVCCPTGDPGRQVHALLSSLREIADEIVVAADSRTGDDDLAWYRSIADRVSTFEYTHAERMFSWLHEQCSSDWILLIAGDEVVSAELLREIPALTANRRINQCFVPIRWLYPDADHWLDERPWWPDFHNRLCRNDGALHFTGAHHSDPVRVDPVAFTEAAIYHLATLAPRREREEKIYRYEGFVEDQRLSDGRLINDVYYLPEISSRRPPAAVPLEDRDAIARALAGTGGDPSGSTVAVERSPLAVTDRSWAGRPFSLEGYRASVGVRERDMTFGPAEVRTVLTAISNEGDEVWPWGLDRSPHLHVAYQLYDREWREGEMITPLPQAILPGTTCLVPVTVRAPERTGVHRVRVDVRHAGHRWFGNPAEFEITVVERD